MSDGGTLSFIFTVFMFFERLVVSGVAGANEDNKRLTINEGTLCMYDDENFLAMTNRL